MFAEELIFCTDTYFIHEYSNEFILNRILFTKILSFLLSQINQSAKNFIQIIVSSYQQQAPKILIDNKESADHSE